MAKVYINDVLILSKHIKIDIIRDVAATAILCIGIINDLESGSNQFLYKVHSRSSNELHRNRINHHLDSVLDKYAA